jgi:hypothetical protein
MKYLLSIFALTALLSCNKGGDEPKPDPQILPGKGIKEISLGDSGQKAVDAFGSGTSNYIKVNNIYQHYITYADKGIQVNLANSNSASIDLTGAIVLLELFAPYSGQTAEKTGIGTAQTAIRSAHGKPDIEDLFIPSDKYNSGIEFYYDENTLNATRIILSK